ncbi:MAG: ATP synthase gamma chain [Candidatus Sericytochromatia bacterium]|nr:MAG: ATP synthase gamma chain [Candidatus Sericytochromatia bacterium]
MPNLKEIKTRIKSVKNIEQITKAMQMVAAAKVRKVQEKVTSFRPFSERIEEVFKNLSTKIKNEDIKEPLLEQREIKTIGVVIITSDKGLCGSYNSNLLRFANNEIKNLESLGYKVKIWLVGNKSFGAFKYTHLEIVNKYSQLPQIPTFNEARMLKNDLIEKFLNKNIDKVLFIYTKFVSMMSFRPSILELLPINKEEKETKSMSEYIFEPDPQTLISKILPEYIENQIYRALLESSASELASRMTAMSAASKNAKEMIGALTLAYNKARQAAITKEILEVVGGAEALEK